MGRLRDHAGDEQVGHDTTPVELGEVAPPYTRPLETPRTRLRPYRAEDEDDFVSLFQDPAVTRYVGDGGDPGDPAEDRALFGRIFSLVYRENRFAVWAVERDGSFIGHAELKPSPSLGYELVTVRQEDATSVHIYRRTAPVHVAGGRAPLRNGE